MSNEEKIEEYRKALEADDREQAEHKAEVAKKYDLKEAGRRASDMRVLEDPLLGTVNYKVLSIREFTGLGLGAVEDATQRVRMVVAAMLKKADPSICLEDVEALPVDEFTVLCNRLGEALPGFLSLLTPPLRSGSAASRMPR